MNILYVCRNKTQRPTSQANKLSSVFSGCLLCKNKFLLTFTIAKRARLVRTFRYIVCYKNHRFQDFVPRYKEGNLISPHSIYGHQDYASLYSSNLPISRQPQCSLAPVYVDTYISCHSLQQSGLDWHTAA